MKILILPNLTRKITSSITASRPRIIFDLITELKKRGHNITVIGTNDSKIDGVKIIPVIEKGFYEISSQFENPFYAHISYLAKAIKMAEKISGNFDIIHNHGYPEFINLLSNNYKAPVVTTIHMAMSSFIDEVYSVISPSYLLAASNFTKSLAQKSKIYDVIYNGIDTNLYQFSEKHKDYLLWIGRLGKAKDKNGNFFDGKGVREAIKLAEQTNSELILSGNVEDPDFFEKDVKPHLNNKIKWIGPVQFEQPLKKKEVANLMKNAKAFLMTTKLEEAFGLVVVEAQSCGTPVISFKRGALPELIKDGKTGFIVNPKEGVNGLKKALRKIDQIKRKDCRKWIKDNFSLEKMTDNYEKIYCKIVKNQKKKFEKQ